ncbi:MAG: GerMN domain-containing protein [Bacillota bacterium]|nr:GerMN domain-containing protein [Bacillota bacterium]
MKNRLSLIFIVLALLISCLITGCQKSPAPKTQSPAPVPSPSTEQENKMETYSLTLYFSDEQAMFLVPETRIVKASKNADQIELLELAVMELIAGPEGTNLSPTFPDETRLLSIDVENGTAVVDFSEELKTKHWGGSAGEVMTLDSLANTLTEFDGIESVQILLEEEPIDSLLGHMDTSKPLIRDESMIK